MPPVVDSAFEIFAQAFNSARDIPYDRLGKASFVRLAALRKQLDIGPKETPEGWERAIGHYFESPRSKYTVADLAANYDTFLRGPVDRFGKLVEQPPPRADRQRRFVGHKDDLGRL